MIQMNLDKILQEKGRSIYWLSRQAGISYPTVYSMVHNRTRAIRFESIEILCQVLECTPNDLFTIDFDQPEGPRR